MTINSVEAGRIFAGEITPILIGLYFGYKLLKLGKKKEVKCNTIQNN